MTLDEIRDEGLGICRVQSGWKTTANPKRQYEVLWFCQHRLPWTVSSRPGDIHAGT